MHAWLGEFHPWLMLNDVKDLVNRQPQGGEDWGILSLRHYGEANFLYVGP